METCSSFRGISWRWICEVLDCGCGHDRRRVLGLGLTNERHSWCMGIKPSGLGLRLNSRQYLLAAAAGDRWPFVSPFATTSWGAFFCARFRCRPSADPDCASVRPLCLLRRTEASRLPLRFLARPSDPELESAEVSAIGCGCDEDVYR